MRRQLTSGLARWGFTAIALLSAYGDFAPGFWVAGALAAYGWSAN
ncbi:hypothetical protein ACFPA8_27635 [Streptomyces ovatisporus]|uniref:Uncharacterized protein n=1 Tax=Streptomyces ovatisporus TaxID=1128682 RepID=A0ABV9ADI3_9ACTN